MFRLNYQYSQIIKRTLFAILAFFQITTLSHASIAYPGLVEYKQQNGDIVNVIMRGSETLKWAETEDGYTLMYDSIGNLVYAELNSAGDLVPSNMVATNADFRPIDVKSHLKKTPKRLCYSERQISIAEQVHQARSRQMSQVSTKSSPVVGTRKTLLILVEFPDHHFQRTKSDFEQLMNQINYTQNGNHGSVRDFFLENSFGQLDLITDVAGVYRLQHERAYYGANTSYSNDKAPQQMAYEAITMADEDVNFADYDNDNDGIIDGVHIIYAGPGEEAGGGADCIWAHSWDVAATVDGKHTRRYSCSPEIRGSGGSAMTYIGVICHEIGHVFGTMDFYDTNYSTGGQYDGTGKWDLMASGNWNNNGACPAHFNPYSKIYDFGWAEPINGNQPSSFTINAKSPNGFIRIDTKTNGEFFLIEYKAKSGFDAYAPYHGLMIYRASEGLSRKNANTMNAYHPQQFYPLSANASYEIPTSSSSSYGTVNSTTTPFPGSLNVTTLNDFSTPSMKSWLGVNTDLPITAIVENVANESVSFNIAGGAVGGAYGFSITDSDLNSVSLKWLTPANEPVVLAYNTTPNFGDLYNRTYSAGESIDGGGEIIYVGNATSFKHSDLEPQSQYFYKIYTLKQDGTYISGDIIEATTTVDIIRKFPYQEDFSSKNLPEAWRNEFIFSNEPWKVAQLYETGNWMLIYNASFTPRRKTRVVMPKIDFGDNKSAVLSFDYRNLLQILEVQYRISETDKWHTLTSLSPDNITTTGSTETINSEKHVDIELPNLTSTYEIAFMVDYESVGSSYSSAEVITIDNISLLSGFDIFVSTLRPTFVSSTMAKIPINAISGNQQIAEKGIMWSIDQQSWTKVTSTANNITEISSLTPGVTIYYRGYAKSASGEELVGNTLSFTTMPFIQGSGTKDDPYLIADKNDWASLQTVITAGNDCQNIYFALNNSFTLSTTAQKTSVFNGYIDGRNHTITLSSGGGQLFQTVGQNAGISNLHIRVQSSSNIGSLLCYTNNGTINNCSFYIGNFKNNGHIEMGGCCRRNEGLIFNCASEIYATTYQGYIGGICGWNKGTIIGCSFQGELSGNNNVNIGGIAGINYESTRDNKETTGYIADCVNNGDVSIYLNSDGDAWFAHAGGITGGSYGWVQRCVNKGNISVINGGSSLAIGGILGRNSGGTIIDCYNMGEISATNNSTASNDMSVGGIAGYGDLSSIQNCFSLTNITTIGDTSKFFNGVIGQNNQTEIENCYYCGNDTDEFATRCEFSDFSSNEMILKLNKNRNGNIWKLVNERPALHWEENGIIMATEYIVHTSASDATISCVAIDENISSMGLEWRKKGETAWFRISAGRNSHSKVTISGLEPATIYETRIYALTSDGTLHLSTTETFATLFDSEGTESDPHIISGYNQMLAFSEMIAHGNKFAFETVKLSEDIDLKGNKGIKWEPMQARYAECSFEGEFDGNGHIIRNMFIDTKKCYAGFFGLFRGYVHDLTIIDSQIICNTPKSTNGYYAGVGGFAGATIWANYNSPYSYFAYKCGFEGSITGGNMVGGIAGRSGEAQIKDCYANVNIIHKTIPSATGTLGVGGIVGSGRAVNSYATGSITIENNTSGISVGPITGTNDNGNNSKCYYDILCNTAFTNTSTDVLQTTATMKSSGFLNQLTPGLWTRADNINDGYPILASRTYSRVTTSDAEYTTNGDIIINGIYTMGANKTYSSFGFQWFSKLGDNQKIVESTVNNSDDTGLFYLEIPRQIISVEGINYRFFAAEANDSIYGEWESFIPTETLPHMSITKVEATSPTSAQLTYSIRGGIDGYIYTFDYAPIDTPQNIISLPIDEYSSTLSISNLEADHSYTGRLVGTSTGGALITGDAMTWTQPASQISEYTLGDPNNDGYIDVADLTAVAQFILCTAGENLIMEAADMDHSGIVEVNDFVALVNEILNQEAITSRHFPLHTVRDPLLQADLVQVEAPNIFELQISLRAPDKQLYTGLQFDIKLPQGLTLCNENIVSNSPNHSVWDIKLANNNYRIIYSSLANSVFKDKILLRIKLNTELIETEISELYIENVVLSDIDAKRYQSEDMTNNLVIKTNDKSLIITTERGITHFTARGDQIVHIVGANGMTIESFDLKDGASAKRRIPRGIYIINGRKIAL